MAVTIPTSASLRPGRWSGVAGPLCAALLAVAGCPPAAAQTVRIAQGALRGVAEDGVEAFKNIPFAAPPVGPLRWKPPMPAARWTGVRDATAFGPACVQRRIPMGGGALGLVMLPDDEFATSEDCLNLNVRRPAGTKPGAKLPVMVWIYGGAFQFGRNSQPSYAGSALVRRGVILVTPNYRLGALGFLAHPALSAEDPHRSSGNYGVLDVVAALRWVKANVAAFGGDPANVTIFGQSAGGVAVGILAGSPLTKGLFARSIAQSGVNFGPVDSGGVLGGGASDQSHAAAERDGAAWFRLAGVTSLAQARALTPDRVLEVTKPGSAGPRIFFRPNIDGWLLPTPTYRLLSDGAYDDRPAMVGSTEDEGVLFGPKPLTLAQYAAGTRAAWGSDGDKLLAAYPAADDRQAARAARDLPRDANFGWSAWTWARKARSDVYLYRFDHRPPFPADPSLADVGAPHGAELPYLFGNLADPRLAWAPGDRALSDEVMGYWVNFARTGDPNGRGLPHWDRFTPAGEQVMSFDATATPGRLPNADRLNVIDAIYTARRMPAAAN